MPFGDIKKEKKKEVSNKIKEIKKDMEIPSNNYIAIPVDEKKKKLDKSEVFKLIKERGKDSVDPDHGMLAEYIFPELNKFKKDKKNRPYLRRKILIALDLILTHCDIYLK